MYFLVLLLSACTASARTFHDGEYVTSARRSQFRQQRTEWHDLLGRYCPRFGRHQVVTIPIQRPSKWVAEDDYKLMLSFDSERLITPWLPLIRASHKRVPHVRVTFTTVGAELRSVSADVAELSGAFLARHARLVEEFENPDVWPKHVVVEYFWEQLPDADPDSGLFAVLAASGLVCVLLTITAKLRYGTGKVDVALYELVSAIEAAQFRQDAGPAAAASVTSSGRSSPMPPVPPNLSGQPGRPPRPQVGPPKRGSHAD